MAIPRWALYPILIPSALYSLLVILATFPPVQRELLYMHHARQFWLDANDPVSHGFAPGQVTPFYIPTPDGQKLHAWHVLSPTDYAKHEEVLRREPTGLLEEPWLSEGFRIVRDGAVRDKRNVIVFFHGNAAALDQGVRTKTYRHLLAAALPNTSLLAFDYRGFGLSSGTPSEAGLIADGLSVLEYVLDEFAVSPARILIVGHSLGTAVAAAAVQAWDDRDIREGGSEIVGAGENSFAGMILVAGFSDLATLLQTYWIAGVIPTLGALRHIPGMHDLLVGFLVDTWRTTDRLAEVLRRGKGFPVHLEILAAKNDWDINYTHSNMLFDAAAAAANSTVSNGQDLEILAAEDGNIFIRKEIVEAGGHDGTLLGSAVQIAVMRVFDKARFVEKG